MAPLASKPEIRAAVRRSLQGVPEEVRQDWDCRIRSVIDAELLPAEPGNLLGYSALPDEPDLTGVLQTAAKRGWSLALPRADPGGFIAARWEGDTALLRQGPWKAREPAADAPRFDPVELDLILIPCRACSSTGVRLGRGGGFYDRFLAQVRSECRKVGIGYRTQLFDELPGEEHDIRLDGWLDETGLTWFRQET